MVTSSNPNLMRLLAFVIFISFTLQYFSGKEELSSAGQELKAIPLLHFKLQGIRAFLGWHSHQLLRQWITVSY